MTRIKPSDVNSIRIEEIQNWIKNFRTQYPMHPNSFLFTEEVIIRIIGQNDAAGFKIYVGYDNERKLQLIIVGTRVDGTDIWPLDSHQLKFYPIGIGLPCTT